MREDTNNSSFHLVFFDKLERLPLDTRSSLILITRNNGSPKVLDHRSSKCQLLATLTETPVQNSEGRENHIQVSNSETLQYKEENLWLSFFRHDGRLSTYWTCPYIVQPLSNTLTAIPCLLLEEYQITYISLHIMCSFLPLCLCLFCSFCLECH